MRRIGFVFLVLMVVVGMVGCNNDTTRFDFGYNTRIVQDQLQAEAFFAAQFKYLFNALNDSAVVLATANWYDSAYLSRSGNQVTLDYGSGRLCSDGRQRSGHITLSFSGFIAESESSATMVLGDDFRFSGIHIGGTLLVNRQIDSLQSVPRYSYTVEDGLIQLETDFDYAIKYRCSLLIDWISGFNSPMYPSDDSFVVKGSCYGFGREHDSFNSTIIDSLWMIPGCSYLRGGNCRIQMPGMEVCSATISYLSKDTCSTNTKVKYSGTSVNGDPVVSSVFSVRIVY